MNYSFSQMTYKYAKIFFVFIFILFSLVIFTRGCINSYKFDNEKRTTIEVESEPVNTYIPKQIVQSEQVETEDSQAQKSLSQAKARIQTVQKQMAQEDGYIYKTTPKFIDNNESFETTSEPTAQILDKAPGTIIIEPAD